MNYFTRYCFQKVKLMIYLGATVKVTLTFSLAAYKSVGFKTLSSCFQKF
jgi:hypothetical protein